MNRKYKLKKDDLVRVIAGKNRFESGNKPKQGKVLRIDRERGRVFVEGVNIVKKFQKPQKQGEKGSIVEFEASIDISNVMIVCSKCGPTRVGYKIEGDQKSRICRKCKEEL